MSDIENVPLFFVNAVEVSGFLNGNCNILFGTARFVAKNGSVETQVSHTIDLRFDLFCAQQLHEALGNIIAEQTKPATRN